MTNALGITLEILSNYPGSRLSVRIITAIKRQFFHMITHVFDNSNLSQEIFAIDTWRAVICSLGHGRKHMLTILPTIWRLGLSLGSYFWQSNYNWVVDYRNMPVENLIRSQLQSEEEITDQRSPHFKLCIAVNFKSS